MKKFWKDFKAFISKGNVIDLAIAVIVGGAFGKIVTSLVNDVIMPLISFATGGVSISDWKWVITPADEVAGIAESALYYGNFIQTILDFLIISFFIFLAIRLLQRSKNKFEEVSNEIKSGLKKKKKLKKGEIVEDQMKISETSTPQEEIKEKELESEDIVTTEKSENEIILAMTKMAEATQKTNESQEKLLTEIRDLLRKQP